jgi:hypothetical protein
MTRCCIYFVDGRPFGTLRDAAAEVSRISGEDAELWRLRKVIDWDKGIINGVHVRKQIIPEAAMPDEAPRAAPEKHPARRPPLLRIPVRGLPPPWH